MIINHNMSALNTYRYMSVNEKNTQSSLEKLSSGLRINKAGDDAAGLAISEKMRGQIRGLDQATRNSQDGISLLQTAEGALNETHSILQRMRELAVQATSDTNTSADRGNIQSEMDALNKEIDRIANTTQFNTKNLLDGSMSKAVNADVSNIQTNSNLQAGGTAVTNASALTALTDANGNNLGITAGDTVTASYYINGTFTTKTYTVTAGATVGTELAGIVTAGGLLASTGSLVETATVAGFTGAITGLTITVKDSTGAVRTAATNALSSFTETTAAANQTTDKSATLQIGANANQNVTVDVNRMDSAALGTTNLQVGTQAQANTSISAIDTAIAKVSTQRSNMGALQNRLEHTINNLSTSSENLTAAESRIRDVDMAKEMMSFQKNNILQQAAQAMLAQANQQPQGVLQLLR